MNSVHESKLHTHHRRPGTYRFFLAILAVAHLGLGATARAGLVITPTFDSSITSDPNAAAIEGTINSAIQVYENALTNPINVLIKFSEGGGLGSSSKTLYNVGYQPFINALTANATSTDDATALAHLPTGSTNPVTGISDFFVTTANLRALGFNGATFPPSGGFDGFITLNTSLTTPGSPGSASLFSLMVVTMHEIDEVLGLGSSLPFSTRIPSPEDLFRYDGTGARSFTLNSSALAYFSIDGTTRLAQFDNQNDGGDFGDWQSNPLPNGVAPKVQDAFATVGATPTLGVELRALDVIGYNLTSVPEPGSLTLFGAGALIASGYAVRRRRPPAVDA
jgi:hypothetical protein